MSKFGRRQKTPPAGFDYIEPTLTALENELRDSEWNADLLAWIELTCGLTRNQRAS